MLRYPCPICGLRACDSNKFLKLAQLKEDNSNNADLIIKCQKCKNLLAVNVVGKILPLDEIDSMNKGA